MGLLLSHPEVAYRTCGSCRRWFYNLKTGELEKRWQTDPETGDRKLLPLARKPSDKLPCWNCPKCEDSTAKNPAVGQQCELSERNWRALRFYFQQKAVGGRVDAMARKNCGIIEWLLGQHRSLQWRMLIELLKARAG